jgi:hypothetical protein
LKIDPKLKNRIRFNQLEGEAKTRLRRFYHVTSAEAALRILQSGFIWSDAQDLCPNFSSNRSAKAEFGPVQEVWLTFNFDGPAHLVPEEFPASQYVPNALYIHLYEWPDMFDLEGMRVANLRVAAGTSAGLECIGYQATPEFLERCKTDLEATMLLTRIKRLAAIARSARVPASGVERKEIRAGFPKSTFTKLDRYKLQFHLFKRRIRKKLKP